MPDRDIDAAELREEGRRLASRRDDLIAHGVDPADLLIPMWCDGTPHSPNAIPPLPHHDWRYDMDNPWLICARCGKRECPSPPEETP
jgi:hypothetical protein